MGRTPCPAHRSGALLPGEAVASPRGSGNGGAGGSPRCAVGLDIYGEDSGAAELHRAVAASNAADRITVYPATDSPLAELASSRINLLASEHEGFGLSLLEAGCLGVPSVAFDVSPGVHDLMTTLGGGLIPEGNHRAYIQAVVDLMTREDHGAQAGRRARRGSLA